MHKAADEFIEYQQSVKGVSDSTAESYLSDLENLISFLESDGISSWADVTDDRLVMYIRNLRENMMADSTIARKVSSIHSFFHFMVENGELPDDVSEILRAPKVERGLPEVLTVREINALFEQPDRNTAKGKRDIAILELMYATGMRAGEIISLNIDDIDFRVNCIRLEDKGIERIIPFSQEARTAIMRYLMDVRLDFLGDNIDDGTLFLAVASGKAMSRQGLWKMIRRYGDKAGIGEKITPYTIRHTFAAHLLDNGADIAVVQEMLGHQDKASTKWYAANKNNYVREIYERTRPGKDRFT
ncbi:tyrosine-type recombinase/integrase [Butyrivibrio sp. MC2013]|uniref:tyrosine-type recombinase/integrase n=1 Tax=Butyrivibrio sp. MC2013 TaxID=1280686 RepID=UPI00040E649D|nr:tyrosine-type recombinase/integrase [Butyrivibrio sp. MC2013]